MQVAVASQFGARTVPVTVVRREMFLSSRLIAEITVLSSFFLIMECREVLGFTLVPSSFYLLGFFKKVIFSLPSKSKSHHNKLPRVALVIHRFIGDYL